MYPVWWKAACGHTWKDKVFNRAVEGAGCIYCESEFRKALPQLLVMYYAQQRKLKVLLDDDNAIGVPLDAVIPELKLSFVFPYKGTNREDSVMEVLKYLCEKRGLLHEEIRAKEPIEICIAIKQAFARAHIYINSDNEQDVATVRERFLSWRKQRK